MKLWRIYRYTNVITGKSYIGQTIRNVNDRAHEGKGYTRGITKTHFAKAIEEYGWENFEQSILRLCTSQEEANKYERYFIDKYNTVYPNGYNSISGGQGRERGGLSDTNSPNKNKHWYNNGEREVMAFECPEGYVLGQLSNHGKHWYNNGVSNVFAYSCPNGFVPGMYRPV